MLFKYVVSGTPGTKEDFRQDVAKILSGTQGATLENLSANCDKVNSQFETIGSEVTNKWTVEVNDGTISMLKRPHSQIAGITNWLEVYCYDGSMVKLVSLENGTGGVRTNPGIYYNNSNYNVYVYQNSSGSTIWIGDNGETTFISNSTFNSSNVHFEIQLKNEPGELKYTAENAPSLDMVWGGSLYSSSYAAFPKVILESGAYKNSTRTSNNTYWQHSYINNASAYGPSHMSTNTYPVNDNNLIVHKGGATFPSTYGNNTGAIFSSYNRLNFSFYYLDGNGLSAWAGNVYPDVFEAGTKHMIIGLRSNMTGYESILVEI